MKSKSYSVAIVIGLLLFSAPKDANAFFFPLPTLDFSVVFEKINQIKNDIMGLKVVKDTMGAVSTISQTIGDAKATIAKFMEPAKQAIAEAERLKKMAEEYKKQFEEYKAYAEKVGKEAKDAYENVKNIKDTATALIDEKKNEITGVIDSAKAKVDDIGGQLGIPIDSDNLTSEDKIYNQDQSEQNSTSPSDDSTTQSQTLTNEGKVSLSDKTEGKFRNVNNASSTAGLSAVGSPKESSVKDTTKASATPVSKSGVDVAKPTLKNEKPALKADKLSGRADSAAGKKELQPTTKTQDSASKNVAPAKELPEKKGFRKLQKLNLSSTEQSSFFYKDIHKVSFADMGADLGQLTGGSSETGARIFPKALGFFCNISVNDIKKDKDKLDDCIKKIYDGKMSNAMDKVEEASEIMNNVRLQNASGSLSDSMQIANKAHGKVQNESLEVIEKSKDVEDIRNVQQNIPQLMVIMSRVLVDFTYFRAMEGVYPILDDVKNLNPYTLPKEEWDWDKI